MECVVQFFIENTFAQVASLIVITTVLWFIWDGFFRFSSDTPSGPQRFPFLGNLLTFAKSPMYELTNYSIRSGKDICTVVLGGVPMYCVSSDTGLARLMSSHYIDRPSSVVVQTWSKGRGIFSLQGPPKWLPNRKLAHSALLAHNLAKKRIHRVEKGTAKLMEYLRTQAKNNKPIIAFQVFCWHTVNALLDMVMGKTWPHPYDKEFLELRDAIIDVFRWTTPGNIIDFVPILRPFVINNFKKSAESRDRILMPSFQEHVDNIETHRNNPRDHLDFCLAKRQDEIDKKGEENISNHLKLPEIFGNQVDNLMLAGFDTTATSSDWTLVYLVNNPHMQEKLHKELKDVCGNDGPRLSDRPKLIYLNAVIRETLRKMPVVPNLFRMAIKDTDVDGFKTPKGTVCLTNVYRMQNNPKYWKNPEKFNTDRWLTPESEGPQNKLKGRYLPFGGGPRECVGMAFAEEQYFDMIANLIHYFKIESVDGKPLSEIAGYGIVAPTQRVPIMFKMRDDVKHP